MKEQVEKVASFIRDTDWITLAKRWWVSLLLIPVIYYYLQQLHLSFSVNLFYSYSYEFPSLLWPVHLSVYSFLLFIHEAGHTFFLITGNRILTILGGSLLGVAMPAFITAYCWFFKYLKTTQLFLFLTGTAWISVGYYAADGKDRILPLIADGGPHVHDWGNLLRHWGLTEYAWQIGFTFAMVGVICYLLAVTAPLFIKTYETVHINLD